MGSLCMEYINESKHTLNCRYQKEHNSKLVIVKSVSLSFSYGSFISSKNI